MNRRELLATTAALVCTGCLGGGGNGGGNGSAPDTTDGTTPTATETDADGTTETTTATETTTTATTATETTTTATTSAETATATTESTTGSTETVTTGTTTDTDTETPGGTTAGGTTTNGTTTEPTIGDSIPDWSFTVRETGGKPGNTANVSIENGGSRVVVAGTITGKNGCQTAVLDAIRTSGGTLRIVVATARAADAATMCTQALVGISYRATVTVDSRPGSVAVVHRGANGEETVATTGSGG